MGSGSILKCKKIGCGYEKRLFYGVGMNYPSAEAKIIKEIKEGKYGEEWKESVETIPNVIVDCKSSVFRCPKCRNIETKPSLYLYLLVDASKRGIGTYWPSPTNEAYKLIKEYPHYCEKCSERLEFIEEPDDTTFYCPDCGKKLENDPGILWD